MRFVAPDIAIYGDTVRSPEMRHEVPELIPDPFLYAEVDGRRLVVIHAMEAVRLEGLGLELHGPEEYGADELRAAGVPRAEIGREIAVRAARAWGLTTAAVPSTFPLELADTLRREGFELIPDAAHFLDRRRVKTGAELAGIRRAVAAAEAAFAAVAERLVEPVTCEELKREISQVATERDCAVDYAIVAHGLQTAVAHEFGSGTIEPGDPVIVDVAPRDLESACFADMTRSFVLGEPSARWVETRDLVQQALDLAIGEMRPGVRASDVNRAVCELFEAHGHATVLSKEPGKPLFDGFFHALGHGIGLEVHEYPVLGLGDDQELREGEVYAVEPGLYDPGWGGVRIEDDVLVTAGGAERL